MTDVTVTVLGNEVTIPENVLRGIVVELIREKTITCMVPSEVLFAPLEAFLGELLKLPQEVPEAIVRLWRRRAE